MEHGMTLDAAIKWAARFESQRGEKYNGEHVDALLVLSAEVHGLRGTMVELLEILRNWEPDHASGEERQKILHAMYQIGILTDPATTLRNMAEADFVQAHG